MRTIEQKLQPIELEIKQGDRVRRYRIETEAIVNMLSAGNQGLDDTLDTLLSCSFDFAKEEFLNEQN